MKILPTIRLVPELPQWIISSDIAAYHPRTKTIWIKQGLGWNYFLPIIIHELTHWAIHMFLKNDSRLHDFIDN